MGGGAPEVATLSPPQLPTTTLPRRPGSGHPPHALGSDVGGLLVIGSVRFFLGKPWRFVLTESLLKLTRVQTPVLPSVGQVTLLKSHNPRRLNFSIYTVEIRPISGSRQGLREDAHRF